MIDFQPVNEYPAFEHEALYEWPTLLVHDECTWRNGSPPRPFRMSFHKDFGFCTTTWRGNPYPLGFDLGPWMNILMNAERIKVTK